ncbi:HTH domain-containing protein [Gracilibacillus massiliensis]|uniref:HTH domain-containing protein n=1 Tax=Gracilibacillus massiliensis TaxID=1564956 RepID=UPI00071D5686|nr:HTH domain-containing protein [Gracilibacillus massiliensis]
MGRNKFSEEQQIQLRSNPFIEKVSETTISYTKEFKERFHHEYQTGKGPSAILSDMGIDPTLLGEKRRSSLVQRIKEYASRIDGYQDLRGKNSGRPSTKELTDVDRIKRLEHQIRYLKQENEFLKKTEFLDRQAEWQENQKQRQKKNSDTSKK